MGSSQIVDIPLTGTSEATGGDSGGYAYVQGMVQTAQNEWVPVGNLVQSQTSPTSLPLSTYQTPLQSGTRQSPDVCVFTAHGQEMAINLEKAYFIASDSRNQKYREPFNAFNNINSGRSYQIPNESTSVKIGSTTSMDMPMAYSDFLNAFCVYCFDMDVVSYTTWAGFYFFDATTGVICGKAPALTLSGFSYPTFNESYFPYTNSAFPVFRTYITESSDGKIGLIGYTGSSPNYTAYELICSTSESSLPDKRRKISIPNPSSPTTGFTGTFVGPVIGYDSFVSDDNKKIDVIVSVQNTGSAINFRITSRKDRVIASDIIYTPTSFTGTPTVNGSVYISDTLSGAGYQEGCIPYCWYNTGPGATTGVASIQFTVNTLTGVVTGESEVQLASGLSADGKYVAAYACYNMAAEFTQYVTIAQRLYSNGDVGTYCYDEGAGFPAWTLVTNMFGMVMTGVPKRVENSFIFPCRFNSAAGEFGEGFVQISNYINNFTDQNIPNFNPIGVVGYNSTLSYSCQQYGYSRASKMLARLSGSANGPYVRLTQIGVCDSLRPVTFQGKQYIFSGFQYLVKELTGLARLGVYTTPSATATPYAVAGTTFSGTWNFRLCFTRENGDGPVSASIPVTFASQNSVQFFVSSQFLDADFNSSYYGNKGKVKLFVQSKNDNLFYEVGTPFNLGGPLVPFVSNFVLNVQFSTGVISYGALATFETGEAPTIGVNSPKAATYALGRLAYTDEFGKLIYTSKEPNALYPAQFSDVLFIQPPPDVGMVKELGGLNNSLVCFGNNSIYAITGTLPTSTGEQSLGEWQKVTDVVGCFSPAATVTTDKGIYFGSQRGLHLLNRSLFVQSITEDKGFTNYDAPPLTFDFWGKSAQIKNTNNILFSTSSLRSRLANSDFSSAFQVIDSVYALNESTGSFSIYASLGNTSPALPGTVYAVSGDMGGIIATSTMTLFVEPLNFQTNMVTGYLYDTGYFCPFGAYSWGTVGSVLIKFFAVGQAFSEYPDGQAPSVTVWVRDDSENSETHTSTQTMETPAPTNNRQTFVWVVRLNNRRCNAIRVQVSPGVWGLRGIALEVYPQPAGAVRRQSQTITGTVA